MAGRQKNDTTIQFLIYSFIGLLIFSIVIFSILGIYMSQKSRKAVYKVGEIYMSGMNEQMSRHFETVIKLRFDQVSGIVSVVSTDNNDKEALYEELIYRAQVRDFDYLALCSAEGNFETLYGHPIQPLNPEPFVEALLQSEQRVAVGVDSDENEVVLFGVDAAYPMQNGDMSTGLIAAVPLEYITDFLSLEDKGQLMYYHIIRPDGSFVIQNPNTELWPFFEELQKHLALAENDSSEENSIDEFGIALKDHKKYAATFEVNGEERQIYGIPLPYSEWYLVAVMPYGILDDTINSLSSQRMVMTLLSCASVLFILTLIFLRYYSMTRSQLHELEKARQTALESSKAKSEFLANMSHDIRTPMNAIVGMTAIATAHMDDREQVQSCLRKITLSSKHLLGLINDVLDMSKIESGKLTLTTEQISLQEVTEGIVNIMQPQVKAKKQTFDIHVDNILTENVWCDGVRLNHSPYTNKGTNIVRLTSFGDSSINILISAYLTTNVYATFLQQQNDLNLIIMDVMQADGVDFAFVRVGNRGYTEGALYADTRYAENIDNATSAGLDVGAYFFSQAVSVEEAREEAEFVLRLLAGRYLALPVAYDHEPVADGAGRANNMDRETLTACARAFCERLEQGGYETMIYGNSGDMARYDRADLGGRPVWFAEYDAAEPHAQFDFAIWQYTNGGSVAGIGTAVDLNLLLPPAK